MRLPFCIISCYYIVALILISCEDPPVVGGDIDFPVTTFVTASDTTFTSSTVTLQWQGNKTARIFDYQLQYNSISDTTITIISDAIDSTSITFYNLDEGNYTFIISSRYDIDNIEDHGATVGVEAPDKNSGTQYLFNYSYHADADTLKDGLAIRFSDSCSGEIPVSWCDCDGNVEDCNGDSGGSAVIDDCGICGGDS